MFFIFFMCLVYSNFLPLIIIRQIDTLSLNKKTEFERILSFCYDKSSSYLAPFKSLSNSASSPGPRKLFPFAMIIPFSSSKKGEGIVCTP